MVLSKRGSRQFGKFDFKNNKYLGVGAIQEDGDSEGIPHKGFTAITQCICCVYMKKTEQAKYQL